MVRAKEEFFQVYKEGNSRGREQDLQRHREIITQIPNTSFMSLNVPFILWLTPTLPLPAKSLLPLWPSKAASLVFLLWPM